MSFKLFKILNEPVHTKEKRSLNANEIVICSVYNNIFQLERSKVILKLCCGGIYLPRNVCLTLRKFLCVMTT